MARNNITFQDAPGGLGRLPQSEDHVSAIILDLTSSPGDWTNVIGKKYLSTEEAEADGIISSSPAYGILHYFISEFFAISGPAVLYVINSASANYDTKKFFEFTEGKVRQSFVYSESNYAAISAKVGELKTFADALEVLHSPLIVLTNIKDEITILDGAAQTDLRALNSEGIGVINFGDGSGTGATLATSLGVKYIPAGGTVLGAFALASVHENIGWVAKFNLARGAEMQSTVFSDGTKIGDAQESVIDTLHDKGYLMAVKHIGVPGTYMIDAHAATVDTSDFAYLENTRTIQKAKRDIRSALLPDLNSPLTVAEDGTLSPSTIKYFENKASRPLTLMENAQELSGFKVSIDPNQDVLATSKLMIVVKLQPRGTARYIDISIGFTASLT